MVNHTRARSYLYVPGDREDMLGRALQRGADALILDLEDAVAEAARADAVRVTSAFVHAGAGCRVELWVRVHPAHLRDQLEAVVSPHLTGIVLPKATAELAADVDEVLRQAERAAGMPERQLAVLGLVETAQALRQIDRLAVAARVVRLGIGEADLRADLGVEPSSDAIELLFARSTVVAASAAAAIQPPVAPSTTDFRDLEAVRSSTRQLVRLGFRARTAIHPAQVSIINEELTPSPDQVRWAREITRTFQEAAVAQRGAVVDHEGRMLDVAVVRTAEDILRRAGEPSEDGFR